MWYWVQICVKNQTGQLPSLCVAVADSAIHHRPLPGVEADGGGQLTQIVNVNLDSEGLFRCEVISDEVFQLDRKEFNLTVLGKCCGCEHLAKLINVSFPTPCSASIGSANHQRSSPLLRSWGTCPASLFDRWVEAMGTHCPLAGQWPYGSGILSHYHTPDH